MDLAILYQPHTLSQNLALRVVPPVLHEVGDELLEYLAEIRANHDRIAPLASRRTLGRIGRHGQRLLRERNGGTTCSTSPRRPVRMLRPDDTGGSRHRPVMRGTGRTCRRRPDAEPSGPEFGASGREPADFPLFHHFLDDPGEVAPHALRTDVLIRLDPAGSGPV